MAESVDSKMDFIAEKQKKATNGRHFTESKLNQLYRIVTEVTNDCLWEWDLQNKEIFWIDGGHKRVLGYPIENETISQTFWESLVHPEDRKRVLTKLNKVVAAGSAIWEDEYRFKKADGKYAFVRDRGQIIVEDNKPSRMIGATQDITGSALAQTQLLEAENKLVAEKVGRQKQITNAVLQAQEKERADVGKELHDNLNQVLGAAKLYIEQAKTDEPNRAMCLDKASDYIINVIAEIRKISKGLVPEILIMGLSASIKSLLNDTLQTNTIKIDYLKSGIDELHLKENLKMAIYRIIQEQLNNILKHADATHASISLSRQSDDIILIMEDNGKGCDTSEIKDGVGIQNIISRAEMFHGSVAIESQPGNGFELRVLLPLNIHP